jgi:hypothetical protein
MSRAEVDFTRAAVAGRHQLAALCFFRGRPPFFRIFRGVSGCVSHFTLTLITAEPQPTHRRESNDSIGSYSSCEITRYVAERLPLAVLERTIDRQQGHIVSENRSSTRNGVEFAHCMCDRHSTAHFAEGSDGRQ